MPDQPLIQRAAFQAPRAMRLAEPRPAQGLCSDGSGDPDQCYDAGVSADGGGCSVPGSFAGGVGCGDGSTASGLCDNLGSQVIP